MLLYLAPRQQCATIRCGRLMHTTYMVMVLAFVSKVASASQKAHCRKTSFYFVPLYRKYECELFEALLHSVRHQVLSKCGESGLSTELSGKVFGFSPPIVSMKKGCRIKEYRLYMYFSFTPRLFMGMLQTFYFNTLNSVRRNQLAFAKVTGLKGE